VRPADVRGELFQSAVVSFIIHFSELASRARLAQKFVPLF